MEVVRKAIGKHWEIDALHLLAQRGAETELLEEIANEGASEDLRHTAFGFLVERQHRASIERALSALVADDQALRDEEPSIPFDTSFGWIANLRSEFPIPNLVNPIAKTSYLQHQQ